MPRLPSIPIRAALRQLRIWFRDGARAARQALRDLRQRLPVPVKRAIRRIGRITAGTVAWTVVAIVGLFVVAHVWLPTITEKKTEIENYLTGVIGNPVELGGLQTFWDGLNPGLRVQDLHIRTATGAPALSLRQAQLSLSWRALLIGNIEINQLTLVGPRLTVERTPSGALRITGLAAEGTAPDTLPDFTDWLLRQREIAIVDGELEWVDRAPPAGQKMVEQMSIRAVHALVRNDGQHHAFELRAAFPKEVCDRCRVEGTFTGNPLTESDWEAELRVQGESLDVQHLPGVVRHQLPAGLRGKLGLTLAGHWREARLQEIRGHVRIQDFSMPVGDGDDVLALRQVETGVHWQAEAERRRLRLDPLRLAFSGSTWQAGRVELDMRADSGLLTVDHVNLTDLAGFLAGWSQAEAIRPWLQEARPGGRAHQFRASWSGSPRAPSAWRVETRVEGLHAEPSGKLPGLTGLSGKLALTPDEGEFRIDSHNGRLDLPRVMYEPIPFARMSSQVRWRRNAEDWWVQAGDIDFRNADARVDGDVELRVPRDRRLSPVIKLNMNLRDGRGESKDRYFPRVTPDKLRAYLSQAIQGGRATHASFVVQGALDNFPFRDGKGKFEIRAQVKNGQLAFLPGWESLRDLDVDMRFTGTGMLLTANSGNLRRQQVSRVVVEIEDFKAPQGVVLTVRGHASGATADAVAILRDSKEPRFRSWLLPGVRVAGQGVLDLDLRIPLTKPGLGLEGEYRIAGGQLQYGTYPHPVDAMRGMIGFDTNGLRSGQAEGRWLGNPLRFQAAPAAHGGVEIDLRGVIAAPVLPDLVGPALSRQVQGAVPWQLQWSAGTERSWLSLAADLQDLEIKLPAPLAKTRGEALTLEARSNGVDGNALLVDLQAGNRAAAKLLWKQRDGAWDLQRARIAVGERTAPLPSQDGLHLSARLPELHVDHWWPILQPAWESSGGSGFIQRVSADVATVYFLDRTFGRLSMDLSRGTGNWSGSLDGESISGRGVITLPGAGEGSARPGLQLSLERLAVPLASPGAKPGNLDPRKLPVLQVKSDSFRYAQYNFGALEFSAEPMFAGWRITTLNLQRPETTLKANGQWAINRLGKHSSRFDVEFQSRNLGEILKEFGYGEELVGGTLNLDSSWNWPGAPGDFALAQLNGEASFGLKDGRLPRISPGAGRLFGAFDLRSLTRILTLDFSSVVSKGLTFDSMVGRLEVESGNAYTRNLAIQVPGADVELRGRIGLGSRDLDMEMDVTPRVSTNLAPIIGGTIIGGPVVGGAIAVLGGVTRKPFEKTTRTEYTVKGQWNDPKVVPVRAPVSAPDETQP